MTVAFVLSGGANLGPMQAGAVVALAEAGIEPDLLVGSSVGALNAAFLSTRPGVAGARALMAAWSGLHRREAFRFDAFVALAGFVGAHDHLVSARQLRRLIRRWVQVEQIQQTTIPLAVVATDALDGETVVLTSGDLVGSVAASAAIPGLFPPVRIGSRWLIDGGLSSGRPVLQAQALGADEVYVITTATAPRLRPARGAVAVAMDAVAHLTARTSQAQLAAAIDHAAVSGGHVHVVPSAQPPSPGPYDFGQGPVLAATAYRRTMSWLADESVTVTRRPRARGLAVSVPGPPAEEASRGRRRGTADCRKPRARRS